MTRNQHRALALAAAMLEHELEPEQLSDQDWNLLLLAAGINAVSAKANEVARQVFLNARQRTGFFADQTTQPIPSLQTLDRA